MLLRLLGLIPLGIAMFTSGQDTRINVQALDGRNGKPLPHQRLLIFGGESPHDVRVHKNVFDLTTDSEGIAVLAIDPSKIRWLQVFVDFQHLCQPELKSFDTAEIVSKGLNAANGCSALVRDVTPNSLIIFSRPRTLREKMQQ
jgi:hypothetical protein